jgi:hypothetical protein
MNPTHMMVGAAPGYEKPVATECTEHTEGFMAKKSVGGAAISDERCRHIVHRPMPSMSSVSSVAASFFVHKGSLRAFAVNRFFPT